MRPSWDDYFMAQAFLISQRSQDPSTKHGAVLVSPSHHILSIGYNGAIAGSEYPAEIWEKRPEKYHIVIHAEMNALLNYQGSSSDLVGATLYVTGVPCHNCLKHVLQKGIKNIVYGHVESKCVDDVDREAFNLIRHSFQLPTMLSINIRRYDGYERMYALMGQTMKYMESRLDKKESK